MLSYKCWSRLKFVDNAFAFKGGKYDFFVSIVTSISSRNHSISIGKLSLKTKICLYFSDSGIIKKWRIPLWWLVNVRVPPIGDGYQIGGMGCQRSGMKYQIEDAVPDRGWVPEKEMRSFYPSGPCLHLAHLLPPSGSLSSRSHPMAAPIWPLISLVPHLAQMAYLPQCLFPMFVSISPHIGGSQIACSPPQQK